MKPECDNLDAYLAQDLPDGAVARFEQHLDLCEACREALEEQSWIDGLLQSQTRVTLEPLPASLYESLHTRTAGRRQSVGVAQYVGYGLAVAAVLAIIAAGWTLVAPRPSNEPSAPPMANVPPTDPPPAPPTIRTASPAVKTSPFPAAFVSSEDSIAVPLESADDEVTIVQVFPTTDAEQELRLKLALQMIESEPNGG